MGLLLDALRGGLRGARLRPGQRRDEFRQLVLARIVEPVSQLDLLRVLEGGRGSADLAARAVYMTERSIAASLPACAWVEKYSRARLRASAPI